MSEDDDAMLAEYRELQRLSDLRDQGDWQFNMKHDVEGEPGTYIIGLRTWPDGSADVLVVRNFTAARARRNSPTGGVVWRHDGALGQVVDGLLDLPAPDDPDAPTRVIGSSPGMWTSE